MKDDDFDLNDARTYVQTFQNDLVQLQRLPRFKTRMSMFLACDAKTLGISGLGVKMLGVLGLGTRILGIGSHSDLGFNFQDFGLFNVFVDLVALIEDN